MCRLAVDDLERLCVAHALRLAGSRRQLDRLAVDDGAGRGAGHVEHAPADDHAVLHVDHRIAAIANGRDVGEHLHPARAAARQVGRGVVGRAHAVLDPHAFGVKGDALAAVLLDAVEIGIGERAQAFARQAFAGWRDRVEQGARRGQRVGREERMRALAVDHRLALDDSPLHDLQAHGVEHRACFVVVASERRGLARDRIGEHLAPAHRPRAREHARRGRRRDTVLGHANGIAESGAAGSTRTEGIEVALRHADEAGSVARFVAADARATGERGADQRDAEPSG